MYQVIAYTLAIAAALSLVGFCEEKLSAMMGKPRRFVWAATMVLSILWPLGMMLIARPVAAPVLDVSPPALELSVGVPGQTEESTEVTAPRGADPQTAEMRTARTPLTLQKQWQHWLPSDRTLLLSWATLSVTLLLGLAGTDLFLHHRASRWRRKVVHDRLVLVSESTGPALLGAWRPKIVMPRWFLDEPAATQSLIIEHELQHIAARDPLLLRLALLTLATVPWNLPLWWQLRRLRQAIELDCDARVLRSGAEAGSYGEVLLAVTQRAGRVPAGAIAMGEPVSALERRIRHLATGPVRYSAPIALAALLFWALGIGVAFSIQAPALPRSTAKIVVRAEAPVLPQQLRLESPAAAIEATPAVPAPSRILAAAQTPPPPRGNSAPPLAQGDGAQALPRLRPPSGYAPTPRDYVDPRSRESTGDALQAALTARPDLLAAISRDSVINTVKHLTVFMTEDGKVDRFYVRDARLPHNDNAYGDGVSTGLAGIVPELLARQWEPLGLRPEQLGQMGFTLLQEGGHDIYVHYAWPRRTGEPLGGAKPNDGQSFRVSFTYAEAAAVIEHYLPGALSNTGSTSGGTPWLILSPEGEVVNSGYAPTPSLQPLLIIGRANPGRRVDYFLGMSVASQVGGSSPDQVVFGWLAPDAPAQPVN